MVFPNSFDHAIVALWLIETLDIIPHFATRDSIVQLTDSYLSNLLAASPHDEKEIMKFQRRIHSNSFVKDVLHELRDM